MAQIENHRSGLNEINQQIRIETALEPDRKTGACDKYQFWYLLHGQWEKGDRISFQQGPVVDEKNPEVVHGVNGVSEESILAVLLHRLQSFQVGDFACPENAEAVHHLQEAMNWLHERTRDRVIRGVEGKLVH